MKAKNASITRRLLMATLVSLPLAAQPGCDEEPVVIEPEVWIEEFDGPAGQAPAGS